MNTLPLDILQFALAPLLDTRSLAAFLCAHRSHAPCVSAYRPVRELLFVVLRTKQPHPHSSTRRNRGLKWLPAHRRALLWRRVDMDILPNYEQYLAPFRGDWLDQKWHHFWERVTSVPGSILQSELKHATSQ